MTAVIGIINKSAAAIAADTESEIEPIAGYGRTSLTPETIIVLADRISSALVDIVQKQLTEA
jgi:hypothetical protein